MSQLLDLFNSSTKPRPAASRLIPTQAVHFFDRTGDIQPGFVPFEPLRKTEYTDKALQFYNTERADMVVPASFQPVSPGVPLDRFSPDAPYYKPGEPGNEGSNS